MRRAALLVAVVAAVASCGSGTDYATFARQEAAAVCHRWFECCAVPDAVALAGAADEAGCTKVVMDSLNTFTPQAIQAGLVRFDAAAGARCLDALKGACDSVFNPHFGDVIPCGDVFPGAMPLGGVCDDDFVCASGDCESQHCVVRPPPTCTADQFSSAGGCTPRGDTGAACTGDSQCVDTLTCRAMTCAAKLPDGQPCASPSQCAGTCTSPTLTTGPGTCRRVLCQGT